MINVGYSCAKNRELDLFWYKIWKRKKKDFVNADMGLTLRWELKRHVVTLYMSSYFKKSTFESMRCSQNSWTCSNQEPYPTMRERQRDATGCSTKDRTKKRCTDWKPVRKSITFVIHEAPAELLEGSPVAHGPERAVELVVGHHQVLWVTSHVDHLEVNHDRISGWQILYVHAV